MVEADLRNIAVSGMTSAYFVGRGDWQATLNDSLSTVEAELWFLCLRNLFWNIENHIKEDVASFFGVCGHRYFCL